MAYKDINGLERANGESGENPETLKLQIMDEVVELPHDSFVRDADMTRENMDLVLDSPEGTIIIQDYFAGFESPALTAPSGASLSPQLVSSFISSGNEYANATTAADISPIGAIQEISGDATITRVDGTTETLSIGSPVYQGDVIETDADSALNIMFVDESSFAVSEETRLAIDEYVFDPASQGGVQNFSVLKGVFVYTSGLIGREDPDDVTIDTPVGSIGIRGTIIAGDVDKGEITVVEGAIVLRNPLGEEMTLASQFETGKFLPDNRGIQNLGQKSANDVVEKFSIVSNVAPTLFSSINDAAAEEQQTLEPAQDAKPAESPVEGPNARGEKPVFDADGATDQDGDSEVDGTVDDASDSGDSDEGALLDSSQDGPDQENAEADAPQTPMMDPTAMKIAHAMGMIDGTNPMGNTAGMPGTMGGMETMMAMSMGTDEMLEDSETVMEMLQEVMEDSTEPGMGSNMGPNTGGPGPNNPIDPAANGTGGNGGGSGGPDAPISLKAGGLPGVGLGQKSVAPDEFFASGEAVTWNYHFDKEFGGLNIDSYRLSNTTFTELEFLRTSGVLTEWYFDGNARATIGNIHGELVLSFAANFPTGIITPGTDYDFDIQIAAINSGGNSGFINYDFKVFNEDTESAVTNVNLNGGPEVWNNAPGVDTTLLLGTTAVTTDKTIFLSDGNDTLDYSSAGFDVIDNLINLGDGTNTVFTGIGAGNNSDNVIIGGDNRDTFNLDDVQGRFHGMDGDDEFVIDISNTGVGTAHYRLNNDNGGILIDGGHSNFRAYNILNGTGGAPGIGDTLTINSAGTLDFSNVNDGFIKGIERLVLGTDNQVVNLSVADVMQMTDNRDTLVIRTDGGDTVNLNGFAYDRNEGIDDDAMGGPTNFAVYYNAAQDVTVLVEDTGATINV